MWQCMWQVDKHLQSDVYAFLCRLIGQPTQELEMLRQSVINVAETIKIEHAHFLLNGQTVDCVVLDDDTLYAELDSFLDAMYEDVPFAVRDELEEEVEYIDGGWYVNLTDLPLTMHELALDLQPLTINVN